MISFFEENNIKFVSRFAKNKCIATSSSTKPSQIQNNKDVKLKKNQRSAVFEVYTKSKLLYLTVQKRKYVQGGLEVVYLISNKNVSAKQTIELYSRCWKIEQFFRTAKQTLGIADCRSRSFEKQELHITMVCIAYLQLQLIKDKHNFKTIEEAARRLRCVKFISRKHAELLVNQYLH